MPGPWLIIVVGRLMTELRRASAPIMSLKEPPRIGGACSNPLAAAAADALLFWALCGVVVAAAAKSMKLPREFAERKKDSGLWL